MQSDARPILVIGGGMAGMTAALEAAEVGYHVILVEEEAFLGGRAIRSHRYFPKMCPPACGFEVNVRRIRRNPRIVVHTLSTVESISGAVGEFKAQIKRRPRYVTGEYSLDETMTEKLGSERSDSFNLGLTTTKAVYRPHAMAYPAEYVVDRESLSAADAELIAESFPEGAIDLDMTEETVEVDVGAVVIATGWRPYDASKLDNLGAGALPNVINNVTMERVTALASENDAPIARPGDGKAASNVAFVQCAGSRDENHLPYCSAVCCMGSLKQARYVREVNEDASVTIFYIDIRTIGRQEEFYRELLDDSKVEFVKGKAAKISAGDADGDLLLEVEDTLSGEKLHRQFDMVVLATGIVPNGGPDNVSFDLEADEYGFIDGSTTVDGVFVAGCTRAPVDISRATKEGTAAALRAIQSLNSRG